MLPEICAHLSKKPCSTSTLLGRMSTRLSSIHFCFPGLQDEHEARMLESLLRRWAFEEPDAVETGDVPDARYISLCKTSPAAAMFSAKEVRFLRTS